MHFNYSFKTLKCDFYSTDLNCKPLEVEKRINLTLVID